MSLGWTLDPTSVTLDGVPLLASIITSRASQKSFPVVRSRGLQNGVLMTVVEVLDWPSLLCDDSHYVFSGNRDWRIKPSYSMDDRLLLLRLMAFI
jgi:hypothetical protein